VFRLDGRTAIVTGGAGALGGATCRAFVEQGAKVAVADLKVDKAEQLADELGAQAIAVEMDVTSEESVIEAVRRASGRLGPIDIMVPTVGYGELVFLYEMDYDQWRRMLDVHLNGTFLAIRHTLPGMLERGWGRVIAFSSIASLQGVARQSHYAAAKGAIDAMVRSVEREVIGRGVTVNAIAPGYFESPLNDGAPPGRLDALRASVPAGRFGDPSEIGALAAYLASPEAAYLSGQVISPNGCLNFCLHTGD